MTDKLDTTGGLPKATDSTDVIIRNINRIFKREPEDTPSYRTYKQLICRILFLGQIGNKVFLFESELKGTFVYALTEPPHLVKTEMIDSSFETLKASPNGKYVLRRTG